jgi:transposase InsO family protein
MPWRETSVMDERLDFVQAYRAGETTMSELCRQAGISSKTGYKWVERYARHGVEGLVDRSRAPHVQWRTTAPELERKIVALKRRRKRYGPKKLLALLREREPTVDWPSVTTIARLLDAHGLVKRYQRRRRTPAYSEPLLPLTAANAVWTADIKGQFRTGDGRWCYPLTIADGYSRFVLCCRGMPDLTGDLVWPGFEQAFRRYGLPAAIRTDNGNPFSNRGLAISRLTVQWIRLGIRHERIDPGHPEQNGCHERMHKTLKAETAQPPSIHLDAQQQRFNRWLRRFNHERPHEALGQRPPAALYRSSARSLPRCLPDVVYPADFVVRQVRQNGSIKWHSELIYVCYPLVGQPVGLEQIDDQRWRVYFSQQPIGIFDEHLKKVLPI